MSASNIHSKYINSVNNLSLRNLGLTGKNPSVACLIVDYSESVSGEVLSYGLTSINGSPHAEINALKKVNKKQITNQTFMYVSLEPCFKLEKCCAKKIANSGIKKVVISSRDPNPLIYNKGIDFLKKNRIKVSIAKYGLNQFSNINKYFFNFHKRKQPFVTLKLALSKNNFSKDLKNKNITSLDTQYFMHKYRLYHDAIAIGYNTYKDDSPQLTCRLNGVNKKLTKFIFFSKSKKTFKGKFQDFYFLENINRYFDELVKDNVKSVLIEGGIKTFSFFLKSNCFDQILLCKSNKIVRGSKKRYQINKNLIKRRCNLMSSMTYGDDVIEIYNNKRYV